METNPNPKYLTTSEVARLLRVTPTMVRIWVRCGMLNKIVRGAFLESDVLAFIAKHRADSESKAKPGPKPRDA
jgi:DNA-binding transcriptional MerR regulator